MRLSGNEIGDHQLSIHCLKASVELQESTTTQSSSLSGGPPHAALQVGEDVLIHRNPLPARFVLPVDVVDATSEDDDEDRRRDVAFPEGVTYQAVSSVWSFHSLEYRAPR